jgi:hypothetical protein
MDGLERRHLCWQRGRQELSTNDKALIAEGGIHLGLAMAGNDHLFTGQVGRALKVEQGNSCGCGVDHRGWLDPGIGLRQVVQIL